MDPTSGGTGSVTGHVRRLRTLKRRKEEKKEAKNKVGREGKGRQGKGRQSKRFECQDLSNVTKLTRSASTVPSTVLGWSNEL
jgi:hypothetical protein